MHKLRKILVPTDFSENAATAYNVAHTIAGRFGAKVDFIHVIETLTHYNKGIAKLSVPIKTAEDLYPQLRKQAHHRIRELMADYLKPVNSGEDIVRIAAEPYRAIADYAKEGDYDLITMATLGEHDSNFLIGSVAEKVIRYSDVPVLSTGSSTLDKISRVIVPVDGSPLAFQALGMAMTVAAAFGASLTLLHVQQQYKVLADTSYSPELETIRGALFTQLTDYVKAEIDYAELNPGENGESLLVFRNEESKPDVHLEIIVTSGDSVHRVITEYTENSGALVVMATHGRSGLQHMLIGSTAERVVRQTALPVITVKPRG